MAPDEEALRDAEWLRERIANRVIPNPSPRNAMIRTESSLPDSIERGYHADGHKTWGFVIYRTTYENDADWAECMRRLRWWAADSMEYYNGQDVLDLMTWTIFDDREQFENMDVPTIRRHFRNWTETAVQSEQSTANMGGSPRYKYCVQIDTEALKSVLGTHPPPRSDDDHAGWVKLIDKNWLPRSEDPLWAGRRPDPNEYEPIDGITDERIGWVKVPLISVMVEYYEMFRDPNMVMRAHRRPPAIM
ncbi:uncharacterized protein RCC_05005 [Ramularia collo-cygni]|uniref:Uncharacterized protein n=1 Tax=Ramularia collo-cygni TaxID=112498 RepID=A0A2D3VC17_9PEZI|nr:uncharacterized protein RCC_05005 [Ramularia collo-cygni]CZT19159.1 uncharacterized protein RCC_05005 [Ramularia collo-cygni]